MTSQHRTKKATFVIDETVLEDAKVIVQKSDFCSLNAFVETAIVEMIKRYRKEEIKRRISAASHDPLFLSDIAEVQRDFHDADLENFEKYS